MIEEGFDEKDLIYRRKNMKIMAIGTLKPLSQEQRQKHLPKEVPATLQLYLDGKMEQFWMRDKEEGVIFLMSVDSVDEADRLLKALPLGQAKLLTFDLMPIGPLWPLGMLIKAK
jgi:hypothetical protein